MSTKRKFYTISKGGKYCDQVIHRCTDLDSAMELFRYLVKSNVVEIDESFYVADESKTPDKDGYVPHKYLHVEKGEPEYHIGTETIEVYTQEEAETIKTRSEKWLEDFKNKAGKSKKVKKEI